MKAVDPCGSSVGSVLGERHILLLSAFIILALAGCTPDKPEGSPADVVLDPATKAAFARDFLITAIISPDDQPLVEEWYFVDALFPPEGDERRRYPPLHPKAFVERATPLDLHQKAALERQGFIVCNLGTEISCDAVEDGELHGFIGLGSAMQVREVALLDFGFGVLSPSGVVAGAARLWLRVEDDSWTCLRGQILWHEH